MLAVLPFHAGDSAMLLNLLVWMRQLNNGRKHTGLLVADEGVDVETALKVRQVALDVFATVEMTTNGTSVQGWPQGPNSLFLAAAKWVAEHGKNGSDENNGWLWMETDAVPLHGDWIDLIEDEYRKCGKWFMGHLYPSNTPGLPATMMSGIAVYPKDAWGYLHKAIEQNPTTAFDVMVSGLALNHWHHTVRIQHFWGEDGNPPTFVKHAIPAPRRNALTLQKLQGNAVLFHRNKDGTLIELLRERHGMKLTAPPPPAPSRGLMRMRRTASIGDVLAATCVARKLFELGFDVEFQANPATHCVLRRIPEIAVIAEPNGVTNVDLDGAYEGDPSRKQKHFAEMFIERANRHLGGEWIAKVSNYAPRMVMSETERAEVRKTFERYDKPWIVICPRSNSWANRTVPNRTWAQTEGKLPGTKFWLGMDPSPGVQMVDLNCRHFDKAIGYLGAADMLVTVDTGPMHVAAALGTPVVAIQQASSPELHLSDQVDFAMVSPPGLSCLNCQMNVCPIHATAPPCQDIGADAIADTVNARLRSLLTEDITVVISIHKPTAARLNRSLAAVLPQVQEVIVVSDGASMVPREAMRDAKIRYVRARGTDLGYGRKANCGARHANGKYLWFLNDDCYVNGDCAGKLMTVMNSDPRVAIVGHLLRWMDGTIQHGGTHRDPHGIGFGHQDLHQRVSRHDRPIEMENVTGASILVRRKAYFDVHGHDEDYFLYCEDNDLCMKLREAGWRVMFTPNAEALHEEHQSTSLRQGMNTIMQASCATFARKWKWYFELNRGNGGLGRFE